MGQKISGDIREQLGIFNINDKLRQCKIDWRELIQRMDDNRLPKEILNYKPEGRRNMGRPQTRWGGDLFPGGRNRASGLSLIVDDDDNNNWYNNNCN